MLKKVKYEGGRNKKVETNLKGQSPIEIEVERNRFINRKIYKDIERDRERQRERDRERQRGRQTDRD
jgi:hypothetical protein